MNSLTTFLLCTLAVSCQGFWCPSNCGEAISDYCSSIDDSTTVCDACVTNSGLCALTNDPLFCYGNLKKGSNCTFPGEPCDPGTNLSYGCYFRFMKHTHLKACPPKGEPKGYMITYERRTRLQHSCMQQTLLGYCYSQCVGEEYGDGEWCYLARRQPGPRVDFECSTDSDCDSVLSLPDPIQCSGDCGVTGSGK